MEPNKTITSLQELFDHFQSSLKSNAKLVDLLARRMTLAEQWLDQIDNRLMELETRHTLRT